MQTRIRHFLSSVSAGLLVLFLVVSPALAKDSIKLGFSVALTGIYSQAALSQINAYEVWKDKVNGQGGILVNDLGKKLPVEFVYVTVCFVKAPNRGLCCFGNIL